MTREQKIRELRDYAHQNFVAQQMAEHNARRGDPNAGARARQFAAKARKFSEKARRLEEKESKHGKARVSA